jgi:molybdopterin synthase sulfur carrier subunit
MAEVRARFWAGAQRAAGHEEETIRAASIRELREVLSARPGLAKVCAVATFLVDGMRADDATRLLDGAVVDVLPPFAGG